MLLRQRSGALFLALVAILLTGFLGHTANAIIFFPNLNGYIDPSTGKYTLVGEVTNYHPTQKPVGNLTIDLQFVGENGGLLAQKQLRVSKLFPLSEITVPYLAPIPFKVVLDDVELSQKVERFSESGMQLNEVTPKSADLLLLSSEIRLIDSNELGKKWAVHGIIKNNHTQPAENVYVVATLYNSAEYIVGVAGLDVFDIHPNRIEPMQNKEFFLTTWLPSDQVPAKAKIHAESKESVLRNPYYFPIVPDHRRTGEAKVGEIPTYFRSNVTNTLRHDQEFYWILQIKKMPDNEYNIVWAMQKSITEHMEIIPSNVQAGKSTIIDYKWMPEQEGHYFYEIFIWSSLDNPVPLSYHRTNGFYSPTDIWVSK